MKNLFSLINYANLILLKPQKVGLRPLNIQVDIAASCNLSCKMCPRRWLEGDGANQNMNLEQFKYICNITKTGLINLAASGEPIMNADLLEMIKFAKEKKRELMTSSNFVRIAQDEGYAEKLIESGIDNIKISLDSADRQTYLKIRGSDYFDTIISGIVKFNRLKESKGVKKPFLRLDFVIQKDNYMQIPAMLKLAQHLGIDSVFFRKLQTDGFDEDVKKVITCDDTEVFQVLRETLTLSTNSVRTNLASLLKLYVPKGSRKNPRRKTCLAPWLQVFISLDGDISPCCSLGLRGINLGNIFKDNFDNIWNSEKMNKMRDLFRSGKNYGTFKVCDTCSELSLSNMLSNVSLMSGLY